MGLFDKDKEQGADTPATDQQVTEATGVQVAETEGGVGATDRRDESGQEPEPGGAAPAGTSGPEEGVKTPPAEDVEVAEVADEDKPEWVVETHGEPPAESEGQYRVIR